MSRFKRIAQAFRRFRCRHGHHEIRTISTGLKRLPWFVGECVHCGMIHDGVATSHGGVIIGEWPSFDAFIRSQEAKA